MVEQFDDPILDHLRPTRCQSTSMYRMAFSASTRPGGVRRRPRERYPIRGGWRQRRSPASRLSPASPKTDPTATYSAGFDAFWEIDLFGRNPVSRARSRQPTADSFSATLDDVSVSVAGRWRGLLRTAGAPAADRGGSAASKPAGNAAPDAGPRDAGGGKSRTSASAAARVSAIEELPAASNAICRAAIDSRC